MKMSDLENLKVLHDKEDFQQCLDICREKLISAQNAEIYLQYAAISSQKLKLFTECLTYLKKLNELNPHKEKTAQQIGKCYHLLLDLSSATKWYSRSLDINPRYAPALNNQALILRACGDIEKAEVLAKEAIDSDRNFLEAYMLLAEISLTKGDFTSCISNARTAASVDSTCLKVNLIIAKAYDALGDSQKCETFLLEELKINHECIDSMNLLAKQKINNNELGEAGIILKRCISIQPENSMVHTLIGCANAKNGDFVFAIKSFDKALELNEKNYSALTSLGSLYFSIGDNVNAIANYRKSIKIHPTQLACKDLSLVYMQESNYAEGLFFARKAIEINENNAESHLNLAQIYSIAKNVECSIQAVKKAIKLDNYCVEAYLLLSKLLCGKKRYSKARKVVEEAVSKISDNNILNGELIRVKYLEGLFDEEDAPVPWKSSDDYYFEDCNGSSLIISFGSNGRLRDDEDNAPLFDFKNVLSSFVDFDKLYVRDLDRLYYMHGLKNSAPSIKELQELIQGYMSRRDYKAVVTLGASSGGFGALLYGNLIGADKIIAFNPQTVLSKEKEEEINDNIYMVNCSRTLRNMNKDDLFYQKCLNIRNFIPFSGHAVIHFSNLAPSAVDARYANYIKHGKCSLIEHESATHLLALELKEKDQLENVIRHSISYSCGFSPE